MDLKHLIFSLLFYLSAGTFLTLGLVKVDQVGRRYFLYHGLGAATLALAAYLLIGRGALDAVSLPWFVSFLVFSIIFSLSVGRQRILSTASFTIAGAAALITIACGVLAANIPGNPADSLLVSNAVLSALLLGFSLMAMLLGHWYLVQPKLSINELGRVCGALILLIIVRFIFGSVVIGNLLYDRSEAEIYRYLLSSTSGIFVLMRWTWGLLAPLLLCYFVWVTVKMRSTQSATGILYVVVLSILTGETLSQYLALAYGIPC